MAEEEEGRGQDLEKATQEQNTKLRGLIDAVGGLIRSSRDLLSRLHGDPGARPPDAEGEGAPGQQHDDRKEPPRSEREPP